ncbi:MAG: hypothetical protein ABFC56_14100, partial [Clostridiaceae bacterium]
QSAFACSSLFGDWQVKIINEVDVMPRDAQDAMLSLMDEMPTHRAIICTSNLDLSQLTPRFQTRLQAVKVESPTDEEIATFLNRNWPEIKPQTAAQIAFGAAGNVRAACMDADSYLCTTV